MSKLAINDMKHEINILDNAINECADESGVVKPWMRERLNHLIRQKEAFRASILYFENRGLTE